MPFSQSRCSFFTIKMLRRSCMYSCSQSRCPCRASCMRFSQLRCPCGGSCMHLLRCMHEGARKRCKYGGEGAYTKMHAHRGTHEGVRTEVHAPPEVQHEGARKRCTYRAGVPARKYTHTGACTSGGARKKVHAPPEVHARRCT